METTEEYSVVITLAFANATNRNITFRGVEEDALEDVKSKIKAINASYPESMAKTFISAIGAQSTMISKAQIVVTREDVIYSVN